MNYTKPGSVQTVALDAVTPVKLFSTRTQGNKGWRLYNPSATVSILIGIVPAGGTAPTYAQLVAGQYTDYKLSPEATVDDTGAACDVYACVVSGTLTVYPKEML